MPGVLCFKLFMFSIGISCQTTDLMFYFEALIYFVPILREAYIQISCPLPLCGLLGIAGDPLVSSD